MDFTKTLDIIIRDLREAYEIIDDFKNYPDVSIIQIELAKKKCKSAEEIITLLKTMKPDSPSHSVVEGVVSVGNVQNIEKSKLSKPSRLAKTDVVSGISGKVKNDLYTADVTGEKMPEIKKQTEEQEVSTEPEQPNPKRTLDKLPESNIVANKFNAVSNTYNEQHGNLKGDNIISSALKSRPVSNLVEAIGINDKFLYVREIFNGDQSSYNEAIVKLNRVDNLQDAKAVIMSYTGEGDENEAVKQLLDLVKRKLPADE
jgi:hypothetical protein